MSDERKFAFEVKQAVRIKSGVDGAVINRATGPDLVSFRDVRGADGKMASTEVRTPTNIYQVAFTGDNDVPDTAWWGEDMIEALKKH